MSADIIEIHALAKGRVQGVGFRYKTLQIAESLQVRGTVENLPNGQVEILAQAPKVVLDQFFKQLRLTFSCELILQTRFAYSIFPDFTIKS